MRGGWHGVRVDIVHPGVIRTDRLDQRLAASAEETGADEGGGVGEMRGAAADRGGQGDPGAGCRAPATC
jgi:hypothetical protein